MNERVTLASALCADEAAAMAALEAVACDEVPELAMSVEHPMWGTLQRRFGVMRNAFAPGQAPGEAGWLGPSVDAARLDRGLRVLERIGEMLDHPDNDAVRERLERGDLRWMPGNKRLAMGMRQALGDGGAHLPWSLQPLNLELSMRVQRHCRVGFVVFYSQAAKLPVGTPPCVELGRVFSTPFGVTGFGTWQEPISQEVLDDEVGLLLEVGWAERAHSD